MKCELCNKKVKGKKIYLNTKRVCNKCFQKKRHSTRTPKGFKNPYYQGSVTTII